MPQFPTHGPSVPRAAVCDLRLHGGLLRVVLLFMVLALVVAMPTAEAQDVSKACGKKWLRAAKKLSQDQLKWMLDKRFAELAVDLDGDGLDDRIELREGPSFRSCDVRATWSKREHQMRVELTAGNAKIIHWIDDLRVERLKVDAVRGRILVSGSSSDGRSLSQWVQLDLPARPSEPLLSPLETPPTRIAAHDATPASPQAHPPPMR